jgi:hypothetical protein
MNGIYIHRFMQKTIENALHAFPTVTLCGPRQSGKTTLCRTAFPELEYVNLEDFVTRSFAEQDPKGFLQQFEHGAIIDEVQLVPSLFSQLQVIIDNDRFAGRDDRKFILTGSSNFAMQPSLRQSLAGRTAVFTLLPLSTREIISTDVNAADIDSMIINGGYPAIWKTETQFRRQIIESYINTYVERDVRRLMEVKDLRKFSTFIRLCASRIGTELNKSSLAVEVGVSVTTIDSWLSVLEASYVIYLLPPWFANIGKRLVKSPKLYFCDTAIACVLLGLTSKEQLPGHFMRGALFENMVVNNVRKYALNGGINDNLYFYRDKTGREIDLITENACGIGAYEIKSGMTYYPEYFKHIDYLKGILDDRLVSSAVVYAGNEELVKPEKAIINYKNFPDNFKLQL